MSLRDEIVLAAIILGWQNIALGNYALADMWFETASMIDADWEEG